MKDLMHEKEGMRFRVVSKAILRKRYNFVSRKKKTQSEVLS